MSVVLVCLVHGLNVCKGFAFRLREKEVSEYQGHEVRACEDIRDSSPKIQCVCVGQSRHCKTDHNCSDVGPELAPPNRFLPQVKHSNFSLNQPTQRPIANRYKEAKAQENPGYSL